MAESGIHASTELHQNSQQKCVKCHRKLVKGVKCSLCQATLHYRCANIDENDVISDFKCEQCDLTDSDFYDAMEETTNTGKLNSKIFIYIIKQKDYIIKELQDKIRILSTQIELSRNINSVSSNDKTAFTNTIITNKKDEPLQKGEPLKNTSVSKYSKNDDQHVNKQNRVIAKQLISDSTASALKMPQLSKIPNIAQENVSKVLNEIHAQSTMEKYININKDEEWKTTQQKRRHRRNYVVGNNSDANKIKGVPKYVYLHVCRVDPATTLRDLKNQLKEVFPEVTCEIINSKQPSVYSSFKVGLYERNFKTAMNPDLWPNGAYISRFFVHRQRKNPPPT